jgi:hypothetical protein
MVCRIKYVLYEKIYNLRPLRMIYEKITTQRTARITSERIDVLQMHYCTQDPAECNPYRIYIAREGERKPHQCMLRVQMRFVLACELTDAGFQ